MYLIDVHGGLIHVLVLALVQPLLVLPLVALNIVYLCGCIRTCFHVVAVRVCFQTNLTLAAFDAVLVSVVLFKTRNEQLPDTAVAYFLHRALVSVPLVEITDNADTCGVRRPYSEYYAFLTLLLGEVRAEELISFRNVSLVKEVQWELVLLGHFVSHCALLLSFRAACCLSIISDCKHLLRKKTKTTLLQTGLQ